MIEYAWELFSKLWLSLLWALVMMWLLRPTKEKEGK